MHPVLSQADNTQSVGQGHGLWSPSHLEPSESNLPDQPGLKACGTIPEILDPPEEEAGSSSSTTLAMPEVRDPAGVPGSSSSTTIGRSEEAKRRKIHKVSLELRKKSKMAGRSSLYDPVMVSLGPYHHGKPELKQAEEFKKICLLRFLLDGANRLNLEDLRMPILQVIDQVRNLYAESSELAKYDDNALVEMMLLDACFIIRYMEIRTTDEAKDQDAWTEWRFYLGDAGCQRLAARDIMVLENQIPFLVLKLIMSVRYLGDEKSERDLVAKFLGWKLSISTEFRLEPTREDKDPPLHILAAFRRVLVETIALPNEHHDQSVTVCLPCSRGNDDNNYYTCGSVTDLNSKGIYFGRSNTHNFRDIKFSSRVLYGKLQLPVRYICDGTLVTFSNMIAYEICPRSNRTGLAVCSYISLMKSLIQTPADVKVLQEAGVFALNRFTNQEQVVEMFKTFDTLDLDNKDIYQDVMNTIGRHSKNKLKTWIAHDLIQTALRSPCTTVAWLSAITFFALTCVSVYYAMHPPENNN